MVSDKAPITLPMTMSRLFSDEFFFKDFNHFSKVPYIYDMWYLTSIHPSKVILDSHRVTETCKMFSSFLLVMVFMSKAGYVSHGKGTSKTSSSHPVFLAAKEICPVDFLYSYLQNYSFN